MMKKITSVIAILLCMLCMLPATLTAATSQNPIIWVENPETGFEEYTDSLGNTWITLTIDEDGNRLILSKDILGVVQWENDFDHIKDKNDPRTHNDYETSDMKTEMDTFFNGGDSDTPINDDVYYLAPELKANAQPVVFPDEEVVMGDGDEDYTEPGDEYVTAYSGGMSYVDESGETTCFALSVSEMYTYLTDLPTGVTDPGAENTGMEAEHTEDSNYASTGNDYDPDSGNHYEDNYSSGGSGWTTRSAAGKQYQVIKASSIGVVGTDHVDNNNGFRPAVWVSSPDTDMDGLTDDEETKLGTNPAVADSDLDGLPDGYEVNTLGTKPDSIDSDGDTITDANEDLDGDGVSNKQEFDLGTKPDNIDSDGDKVDDFEEVNLGQDGYITNPLDKDSDKDGLDDRKEAANKTNPNNIDSDGDKVDDYEELNLGQDGYITNPLSMDSDDDGLDDRKEASNKTNPNNEDTDNDGLLDGKEVELKTNPLSNDSDNDGVIDGEEVALGLNPLSTDSDNDGVTDGEEITLGTDPLVPDSDIVEVENDENNQENTNQEETLEETGSVPFTVFFIISVIAFLFALYTRFRNIK